jgi:hypothetical protein
MPIFKSTYNILKKPDEDEVFNENWMDSDTIVLPPTKEWDYQREMTIEDVDIWEVILESGSIGIYASWCPYAEFYMISTGANYNTGWVIGNYHYQDKIIETYYGKNSTNMIIKRAKELGLPLTIRKKWVEEEDMWLYTNENNQNKTLILP